MRRSRCVRKWRQNIAPWERKQCWRVCKLSLSSSIGSRRHPRALWRGLFANTPLCNKVSRRNLWNLSLHIIKGAEQNTLALSLSCSLCFLSLGGGGGGRQKAAKWIIGRPDAFSPPNHPCNWLRQCNRRCFVSAFYILLHDTAESMVGKIRLIFKRIYRNEKSCPLRCIH